jgi:hypothetical protein
MYLDITNGQAVMQGQAHSHGNRKQEWADVMSTVPTTFFSRSVAQAPTSAVVAHLPSHRTIFGGNSLDQDFCLDLSRGMNRWLTAPSYSVVGRNGRSPTVALIRFLCEPGPYTSLAQMDHGHGAARRSYSFLSRTTLSSWAASAASCGPRGHNEHHQLQAWRMGPASYATTTRTSRRAIRARGRAIDAVRASLHTGGQAGCRRCTDRASGREC